MKLTKEQWNNAMECHESSDLDMLVYIDGVIPDGDDSKDMIHDLRLLNSLLHVGSIEIEQRYNSLKDALFKRIKPDIRKEIDWEECIKKAQDRLRDIITAANKADPYEMTALMCSSLCGGEDDMSYMEQ